MRSVSIRLRSSGMSSRKLRRPASTWKSGRPWRLAARAPASVALVSPRTSTPSGRTSAIRSVRPLRGGVDLLAVGQRADAEVVVGHGQLQVCDLQAGHLRVVVLSGVDQHLVHVLRERRGHGRGLDDLRAGADHGHQAWLGGLSHTPNQRRSGVVPFAVRKSSHRGKSSPPFGALMSRGRQPTGRAPGTRGDRVHERTRAVCDQLRCPPRARSRARRHGADPARPRARRGRAGDPARLQGPDASTASAASASAAASSWSTSSAACARTPTRPSIATTCAG